MTRVHPRATSSQHERWYELGLSCLRRARRAIWAFAMSTVLASLAMAQSTSSLNGNVSDSSGAAVAGAKITLTDPATGSQRTTTSNGSGLYQFLDVPPGEYHLDRPATGFAPNGAQKITLMVKFPPTLSFGCRSQG